MLIKKSDLKKIIREQLIREAYFSYEIKPGKDYTVNEYYKCVRINIKI